MERMPETYQQRLARIRSRYPRAYETWTQEELATLLEMVLGGRSIKEVSIALRRQPSAVRSRIAKLRVFRSSQTHNVQPRQVAPAPEPEAVPVPGSSSPVPLSIELMFEWRPVLRSVEQLYTFPSSLTPYMQHRYKWPAVYRWVIYRVARDKPSLLYIGSTKKLCPDRLSGYLLPKGSATNERLNGLFQAYAQEGFTVALDILVPSRVTTGNATATQFDFNTQTRRSVVEELLINHYRQQGIELLNR
jgi:hypothetical protein